MKKILLSLALVALAFSVSANSIRYFTYSQAQRTIRHLDAQVELMIYCGYEDEIETYVLVNEVWAEKVNSQFYEIWLYGFDAYTGDEIYMPIDLGCIWLYNSTGSRMYSAATTLRFRYARPLPRFSWMMPPYRPFQRRFHAPGFLYTYHYDIHQPGWHHPYHGHNPYNYHPYYMRHRSDPFPTHHEPYTPGVEMPRTMTPDGHGYLGNTRGGNPTRTVANPTQMATSSSASARRTTGNTANPNTIMTERSTTARSQQSADGQRTVNTNTGSTTRNSGTTTNTSSNSRSNASSSASTSRQTNTNSGTTTRNSGTSSKESTTTTTRQTNSGSSTTTRNSGSTSTTSSSRSGATTSSSSTSTRSSSTGTTSSSSTTRQSSASSSTSTRNAGTSSANKSTRR